MSHKPKFTEVQYHQAYTITFLNETSIYHPSMTAIDEEGQVWRTIYNTKEGWQPWSHVSEFDN